VPYHVVCPDCPREVLTDHEEKARAITEGHRRTMDHRAHYAEVADVE